MSETADYAWLTGPAAATVHKDLAADDAPLHSQLHRLRKVHRVQRARLAVERASLRKRAAAKFGRLAEWMFFTDATLQQATDLWIGRYKAKRFPQDQEVVDYCTGNGGDLLALAERSPSVGWERTEEVALLAEANLRALNCDQRAKVFVGNVEVHTPEVGKYWHLGPDRRVAGRRSTKVCWHSPGTEFVQRWLSTAGNAALKLAPAAEFLQAWRQSAELEWISRDRQCRQLIAWFGDLATRPGKHRATRITTPPDEDTPPIACGFAGDPGIMPPLATKIEQYVYDTDPTIRAADLTGVLAHDLGLEAISQGASYLTASHHIDHPLVSCFRVTEDLPLRTKPLATRLRSLGVGRLEIKKRGIDADPEQLRRCLKLRGDASATLLLSRQEKREIALLAQ